MAIQKCPRCDKIFQTATDFAPRSRLIDMMKTETGKLFSAGLLSSVGLWLSGGQDYSLLPFVVIPTAGTFYGIWAGNRTSQVIKKMETIKVQVSSSEISGHKRMMMRELSGLTYNHLRVVKGMVIPRKQWRSRASFQKGGLPQTRYPILCNHFLGLDFIEPKNDNQKGFSITAAGLLFLAKIR